MKMKKFTALFAAALMVGSVMTGCGKGGDDKSSSGWDSSSDITVVSREDGSGTRGAFVELFGVQEEIDGEKVDMTTTEANTTNSTSVMMTTVAGNEYAIGYISLGSLDDSVKALKIDGAEATAENIKDGSYKVSRPFNIATKGEVSAQTQDFINYIMSEEGQKVVEEEGYIPMENTTAYSTTNPSGKIAIAGSSSISPLMEKLKEAYLKLNPNVNIEIQTNDSTTGMTSVVDGIADIGMASRELKDSETEKGLTPTVIALDGIAVIVNNENPTDELGTKEVKSIYTGDVLTWDQVVE